MFLLKESDIHDNEGISHTFIIIPIIMHIAVMLYMMPKYIRFPILLISVSLRFW